jgi:peptide/nickel transport system permease protein
MSDILIEETRVSRLNALLQGDVLYSFRRSKAAVVAAVALVLILGAAAAAPWIAPHNPYDLSQLSLANSQIPPAWMEGGHRRFLFGTDDQGRDLLSAILHGLRTSLAVGILSVAFAGALGILLGLCAGYVGGALDSLIMRLADVQLTFPAILVALLIDGTLRAIGGGTSSERQVFWVLVVSIGLSFWVQYARTIRGSTLIEKHKDYVLASRVMGIGPVVILFRHILPNIMGPVLVIATINLAFAIVLEATLSFLGVGLPPSQPSLGTLIRIGNNFLFSGEWWIVVFPSMLLVALILAVNVLGDWVRDALNPKLR